MSTNLTGCQFQDQGSFNSDHLQGNLTSVYDKQKEHMHKLWMVISLCTGLFLISGRVNAQTDFAPGEIMFTGYASDPAGTPPPYGAFSIVLLTDVINGTVIYITDRGWSNTSGSGFRVDPDNSGEGTISFTFTADYSCGTEFIFTDLGTGANAWQAKDKNGNIVGTVVIQAGGDVDGMELGTAGDQLFIYQSPEPTFENQASFVTAILMDNPLTNATNDNNSALPNGLTNGQAVRFNIEQDDAKYLCTPNVGQPLVLQAAISNDNGAGGLKADGSNNWTESQNVLSLNTACNFCCGIGAAPLSALTEVLTNQVFTITITGTLPPGASWQLFTNGCGVGTPQTTMSNVFTMTAPGSTGNITYYVRPSADPDCPVSCSSINVCVVSDLISLCTNCTANMATCSDCFLPAPSTNPDLDSGCYAISLVLVLDESGSIGGNAVDVKNGVLAFLNALNGQDAQVALIEFSDFARVVNNYIVCNDNYIAAITGYFNGVPYNGQTYVPNGGTNWHDAMMQVDLLPSADLVLFFTDGFPTCWTQLNGQGSCCPGGGGSTEPPEIVNPVKLSNKIKNEGTHMFMLGVGGNINIGNLEAMSGYERYLSGTNTLGTSDYSVGEFVNLANDLQNFLLELCRTTISIDKEVLGPVCADTVVFRFTVHNLGTESATNPVFVSDTFPSSYTDLKFYGTPATKICPFEISCIPLPPANAFLWITQPIPPLSSISIMITATVLPTGNSNDYTNIVWAHTDNGESGVSDTFPGSLIVQNMPPTIACPSNVTIACSANILPANTGTPIVTDPDGPTPILSYSDVTASGSCPVVGIITRTWSANDGCNDPVTCIQTITLTDTAPPVITCPSTVSVSCNSSTMPAITGTATATDLCDPSLAITYTDVTVAGSCPVEYSIHRTWTASDDCGNTSTCVQTIFIEDNESPILTCSNILISCTESIDPSHTGYPGVSNNCGGTSVFTYSDQFIYQIESPPCSLIRTWTATDNCGNSATCLQTIVLRDLSGPAIFCPPNVTISCTASTLSGNTGVATATDNCTIAPIISHSDAIVTSPTCTQNKTITRTWNAFDECGNSTTCVQSITVIDNAAPSMSCPVNVTISCTASSLPGNTGTATATDNCSTLAITSTDVIVAGICPQEMTITRTWHATDACGNSSTCNQTITVDDNAPPAMSCPANVTIDCTASTIPANTGTATATDNCSTIVVTSSDVIVPGICPQEKTITRTWHATDACGNSSMCNQIITVEDNTPPVISCPSNLTIQCTESSLPILTGSATLTDNCDASPILIFSDITTAGPAPHGYSISRTWTGTDHCSNGSTCVQAITVENPLDPEITGLAFDTICSGESVIFNAVDQGLGAVSYQWNFGSGASPGTATGIGPHTVSYTYNGTNGTIGASVVLTVSIDGCASVADTVANVHVNVVPDAAINGLTTNLCYYTNRTFQPVAAQIPGYTYNWDFGSGANVPPISSYGPHHVKYTTTGLKTVQLIINTNAPGASCSDTATISFTVISCPGNITGRVRRVDGTGIGSVNLKLYPDNNLDGLPDNVTAIRSVNSSSNGSYNMLSLTPGQYTIDQTQPNGYISVSDMDETDDHDTIVYSNPNDNIIPVTIEPSEIDQDNVFIEAPSPGIITGYVFQDLNNNVVPEAGEGIYQVIVDLYTDTDQNGIPDAGGYVKSDTTSAIGYYEFGGVLPGNYVLSEIQPGGYTSASDVDVSNDLDNVPNTNTHDDILPVTIVLGETDADNYFIETQVCGQMVTNINDNGPGSLRYVINCSANNDTISFHPFLQNQVIHLNSGRIVIDKNLIIHSGLTPRVKIQSDISGAFQINAGKTVEFKNIDVISGLTGSPGAAFENYGHLIFWDMYIYKNALLLPGNYLIYNSTMGEITVKGGIQIDSN